VAVSLSIALLGACQTPPSGGQGGSGAWSVDPSATDPALDVDLLSPNLAYAPTVAPVGRLAVIFAGTGAGTSNFGELTATLRTRGFHVVVLRYSNSLGTLSACPDSVALTQPECPRAFRSEVTFGAGVPDPTGASYDQAVASVDKASSVVNRLSKLLDYLRLIAPSAGWEQFQQRSGADCDVVDTTYDVCAIDWSSVSAAGHSQGAGVALYLAKFFPLKRVAMLSGPVDAHVLPDGTLVPATWLTDGPLAVPTSSVWTLLHTADPQIARMRTVADAIGVPGTEVAVSAASTPPPGSNRLITSLTPACFWDSAQHHNSTAIDACTPDGAYTEVWATMLGT
jgi:hypothetical protein